MSHKQQIEELQHQITILKAIDDGKTIQYREHGTTNWKDLVDTPNFRSICHEFRVKPDVEYFIPRPGTRVIRNWEGEVREMVFIEIIKDGGRYLTLMYPDGYQQFCCPSPSALWAKTDKIPLKRNISPSPDNHNYYFHFTQVLNPETCQWS